MLHNSDIIEGFPELLAASGIRLFFDSTPFTAVFSTQSPTAAPYALTPGDDQTVRVSTLASVFVQSLPAIGDYFEDESGTRYRIKSRIRRPGQPIVRFTCEISEL